MSRLFYSTRAIADLKEISEYIEQRELSPAPADRWIERLQDECESIAQMPNTGAVCDDVKGGLRSRPIKSYVIFYRFAPDKNETRIVRILHGARDVMEQLREDV